jgi:hypothetical protein
MTAMTAMGTARASFTLTLLPNGKVLAVGGQGSTAATQLSTAEIYDPSLNSWTATGNNLRSGARLNHQANLLPNGKVLITGGDNGTTAYSQSELYDPVTGTFTTTTNMSTARTNHTMALLPSGKLVAIGGATSADTVTTGSVTSPTTTALGTNWTNPANAKASDTTYAVYNTTTQDALVTNTYGFSVPSNGQVIAVGSTMVGFGSSATAAQRQIRIALTTDASTIAGTEKNRTTIRYNQWLNRCFKRNSARLMGKQCLNCSNSK